MNKNKVFLDDYLIYSLKDNETTTKFRDKALLYVATCKRPIGPLLFIINAINNNNDNEKVCAQPVPLLFVRFWAHSTS